MSTMTALLRAATVHDAPVIDRAFTESRADLAAALPEPLRTDVLAMQRSARDRDHAARFPDARWWLIADGADPVGALLLDETPPEFRLLDLVVFAEHRGRGHGTSAVSELCRRADAAGTRISLNTAPDNVGARRIYERAGFTADGGTAMDVVYCREAIS